LLFLIEINRNLYLCYLSIRKKNFSFDYLTNRTIINKTYSIQKMRISKINKYDHKETRIAIRIHQKNEDRLIGKSANQTFVVIVWIFYNQIRP
jgi:hypothetical protein